METGYVTEPGTSFEHHLLEWSVLRVCRSKHILYASVFSCCQQFETTSDKCGEPGRIQLAADAQAT